jgi:hypothetical protein
MRLKKGKTEGVLKKSIDYVYSSRLRRGGISTVLAAVSSSYIYNVIRSNPTRTGVPEIIHIVNNRYVIYPIPDKNYYLEILGSIKVKL